MTYDSRGRLETQVQGTRSTLHTYDSFGRLETLQNALSQLETFGYDAAGRLTAHELPDGAIESFGYDAFGLRTSVTPPGRPAHFFVYTPDNRVDSYTPPDVGFGTTTTSYDYDLDGKPTNTTRPDSLAIDTVYDSAGRRQTVTLPGGSITYGYHPTRGNLTSVSGPYATNLGYAYDGGLQTSVSWSGAVQGSVAWTYDNLFRKETETVSGATGSAVTRFGYDADNLVTCASPSSCAPVGTDALVIMRDPQNGLLTARNLGNVTETVSYNEYGELASQHVSYNGTEVYSTA